MQIFDITAMNEVNDEELKVSTSLRVIHTAK